MVSNSLRLGTAGRSAGTSGLPPPNAAICWGSAYLTSVIIWYSTVRVYRLRLPRGTTADSIGEWIAQLAGVLRTPRWWDLAPRWPV
jgi:hypothetical protein